MAAALAAIFIFHLQEKPMSETYELKAEERENAGSLIEHPA